MTRFFIQSSALLFLLCMVLSGIPLNARHGGAGTADTPENRSNNQSANTPATATNASSHDTTVTDTTRTGPSSPDSTATDTTITGPPGNGNGLFSLNKTPFARAVDEITNSVRQEEVKKHIYFLASDELKGRATGSHEQDIAARYIAEWLRASGVGPVPGHGYFQQVPLILQIAPEEGELALNDSTFRYQRDFVVINNMKTDITAPITVLGYGVADEIDQSEIAGKIVVVRAGYPGQNSPQQWYATTENKREDLQQAGAVAVIEMFNDDNFAWDLVRETFHSDRMDIDPGTGGEPIPYLWFNSIDSNMHSYFNGLEGETTRLTISGTPYSRITARNVVGYIKGTDPDLKDEHLLLGAHYDHIGVADTPQESGPVQTGTHTTETGTGTATSMESDTTESGTSPSVTTDTGSDPTSAPETDTIYNGARDNAVGTSGIMHAARYFAKNPTRRSIIVAAWTAEEEGLLGSYWFSENPMVPLDQIIFNLNIDSAGYNDTTKVMVIGLERTGAEAELTRAVEAFGLGIIPDPVPEQDLFNRSDNVNFATHGIPSPTYSVGLTAFDDEINRYYHTVEDDPETVNYPYITRYIRSFVMAAGLIANQDEVPFWLEGDYYEQAGIDLYGQ